MRTKIIVVDDHGIVRQGLCLLLGQEDDFIVVGEASDGREAIQLARKFLPDLVVMDICMPYLNGIDAAVQIMSEHPMIKVLILSGFADRCFVTEALQANVAGYVLKENLAGEMMRAIRTVMAGEQYLSPKVAGVVVSEYISKCQPGMSQPSRGKLTSKERELIQLLAEGRPSKEAARILHVSVKTVDARRRSIMQKLKIDGIANLTKYAIRVGLTATDYGALESDELMSVHARC